MNGPSKVNEDSNLTSPEITTSPQVARSKMGDHGRFRQQRHSDYGPMPPHGTYGNARLLIPTSRESKSRDRRREGNSAERPTLISTGGNVKVSELLRSNILTNEGLELSSYRSRDNSIGSNGGSQIGSH